MTVYDYRGEGKELTLRNNNFFPLIDLSIAAQVKKKSEEEMYDVKNVGKHLN